MVLQSDAMEQYTVGSAEKLLVRGSFNNHLYKIRSKQIKNRNTLKNHQAF